MSKKILTVGYVVPGHDDYLAFDSKSSLVDADLIIFSPEIDTYFSQDTDYQGKTRYSQDSSFQVKEALSHWRQELLDFVKSGRNILVLLAPKREFYLHTGQQNYSGTGRSRVTTNIVNLHNNYEALPVILNGLTLAHGKELMPTSKCREVFQFAPALQPHVEYSVYFRLTDGIDPIYTTKDKSRIVAASMKCGKGNIVFLPYLKYEEENFTEYKTVKGEEEAFWNKKGMAFGQQLIDMCLRIDSALNSEVESTPPPTWSMKSEHVLPGELDIQKNITKINEQIEELRAQKSNLDSDLIETGKLRGLLYETGTSLEYAVIQALKLLGFAAENYNDGELELDQVIVSPENIRYIGECEGKDGKPINIDKLRQLIESMNADFAREEVDEKAFGILFGNPNRLKAPDERQEWFTAKCIVGAKREGIALVKTPDLFEVVQYLMENNDTDYAKQCREAIKNCLGECVEFPQKPDATGTKPSAKPEWQSAA